MKRQSRNKNVKRSYLNAFQSDSNDSCLWDGCIQDDYQLSFFGSDSETVDVRPSCEEVGSDMFQLFESGSPLSQDQCQDTSSINSTSYDDSIVDRSFSDSDTRDIPKGLSKEWSLSEELLTFFQLFNVSEKGMQYLLDVFRRHGVDAPHSVYALKKTQPKLSYEVESLSNGKFSYFGIKESLIYAFENGFIEFPCDSELEVIFNIDGLPLYKSSNVTLWPILMKVDCVSRPLPVAFFLGKGKPDLHLFLERFVEELALFTSEGVKCTDKLIKFRKILFACDAPAKSFICKIKGHNAKEACQYCDAAGEYSERRIIHPLRKGNQRNDEKYASNAESNQIGDSPLLKVPSFGIYRSVVIDYQHAVCLGVVRKLFRLYFKDKARVSKSNITALSDLVEQKACHTPVEFQRRPRRIDHELDHFKATEYRLFLLYVGPFFLKKFLPSNLFEHFLSLHYAIYVFCSNDLKLMHNEAYQAIQSFVLKMESLFGRQTISFNLHTLLHINECVNMHGPLDLYSTFQFENYLGQIKRRLKLTPHISQHVLQQLLLLRKLNVTSPLIPLKYDRKPPNNCCIVRDKVIRITDTFGDTAVGHVLTLKKSAYLHPVDSGLLKIGYYVETTAKLRGKPSNKCFMIPVDKNYFYVVPFVK